MAFHELRFPTDLSFGALGGPERRTEIVTLSNGFEERNTPWHHSRRRYDAGMGVRSMADLEVLIAFFEARAGQLHSFRWKDWSDFRSAKGQNPITPEDQVIAIGDGERRDFQLAKEYRSGAQSYLRPLKKPVHGTVRLAVAGAEMHEGIDWSIDETTGIVTFVSAPETDAPVTAGYEFDVPVRFDTDAIQIAMSRFNAGEVPDVPGGEVRL